MTLSIGAKALTSEDVGKGVTYKNPHHGYASQHGVIKSWNETYVFVVYKCDSNWGRFFDYTAEATDPLDLAWGWI